MCNQPGQHRGPTALRVVAAESPLDEYPWSRPAAENALWFGIVALGTALLGTIHPWLAASYAGYSLLGLYVAIPILVCTSCVYYGHTCHSGQGRIAARIAEARDRTEFPIRFKRMRLAAPVFLAPLVGGIVATMARPSLHVALQTVAFGVMALGLTRAFAKRHGCPRCKQRPICPACQPRPKVA